MKDKENLVLNQEIFRSQLMQTLSSLDNCYRQVLVTSDMMPKSLETGTTEAYNEFSEKIKVSIKRIYHEVTLMKEASLVVDNILGD